MYIADLHIHSKYSRATSRDGDAPHLDLWARYKGIGLVGTGDFTHPAWRKELQETLIPAEEGLYRLKEEHRMQGAVAGDVPAPRFVISGEISTIYKKDGKTRKVHHVILLPSLEAAESLSHRLEAIGNLHSDGRPILGLDSHDLLEIVLESCPEAIYIPAHIWTPHFSLFGAFSGFDALEDCYGDLSQYVHALETGLSSDPPMNRRCSALDRYTLVSNSDAHSPSKLGREANLLNCALSYPALSKAIQTGEGFEGTIEFFPEEGKYHMDGHRGCGCCLEPSQTAQLEGRCPVCGRKLTIGVAHRVEELADRPETPAPALDRPFESLMPLPELLADCLGVSPASKRVQAAYFALLSRLGPEFSILRELPAEALEREAGFAAGEGLRRLRAGKVLRQPGFDGQYGVISLFAPHELELLGGQTTLLDMAGVRKASVRAAVPATPRKAEPASAPVQAAASEALNPQQEEAVQASERVVAVIAGPGTGKTKTLVARIAHLIEDCGVSPSEITAVTFTNQAAAEMRQRLEARLGGKKAVRGLNVGTFHAICLQLIDAKPLIGQAQAVQWLAALLKERGEKLSPAECQRRISTVKNGGSADLPEGLLEAYEHCLQEAGVRDLDGVLTDALDQNVRAKRMFTHLLVDEFQDINPVQHELVWHWMEGGKTLFVIGDPDQSIYGFRGANAACFDALKARVPDARIIALEQNYRSAPAILRCALKSIAHNAGGARVLRPHRPEGSPVRVVAAPDGFSEGVFIAKEIDRMVGGVGMLEAGRAGNDRAVVRSFADIAVLCRTRRQLEQIEMCLQHDGIPCVISGREEYLSEPVVQGMLGFFRSLLNPKDAVSLRSALTALFGCGEAQSYSAEAVWSAREEADIEAIRALAMDQPALASWAEAAEDLLPRLRREKPRKLLENLAGHAALLKEPKVQKLLQTAALHDDLTAFLQALLVGEEADIRRVSGTKIPSGAVRLMTLHGAKGLEFPVVFLSGVSKGELPLERGTIPADMSEERRLFFVGITRAREELVLTCGGEPSAFLDELPGEVLRASARASRREPQTQQMSLF